jgi:hypothetical protein
MFVSHHPSTRPCNHSTAMYKVHVVELAPIAMQKIECYTRRKTYKDTEKNNKIGTGNVRGSKRDLYVVQTEPQELHGGTTWQTLQPSISVHLSYTLLAMTWLSYINEYTYLSKCNSIPRTGISCCWYFLSRCSRNCNRTFFRYT